MTNTFNIGVDVGNFDTKTQHTSTPSGFSAMANLPFSVDEYVKYNGKYYVVENERFPYVKDKTKSDNCFILTLFGIAKELIEQIKEEVKQNGASKEDVDKVIESVINVNLGVGLPPAHCALLTEKTENYYNTKFSDIVEFTYKGQGISEVVLKIKLNKLKVYPQDVAAALTYISKETKKRPLALEYAKCYVLDIGGQTVDIVPIVDRRPEVAKCTSKEKGILRMCEDIIPIIERDYDTTLSIEDISFVLSKKKTIIDGKVKEAIFSLAHAWIDKILDELRQGGVDFKVTPLVFMGGGSLLLKEFIEDNPLLKVFEFIPDTRANAMGYAEFIKRS